MFVILPLVYFTIMAALNLWFVSTATIETDQRDVLIAGDSHPLKALDPALFESATNIGQFGEPYQLTFWKLRKLLPAIDPSLVIVGFSQHNIAGYQDLKFAHSKWSSEMFSRSYLLHRFNSDDPFEYDQTEYYRTLFTRMALIPRADHVLYIGEYENTNRTELDDTMSMVNRHYYFEGREHGVSKTAANYLDSIVSLCQSNNTNVVLIGCPVHDQYFKQIPADVQKSYRNMADGYLKDGVPCWDYTSKPYDDSHFLNIDHLNQRGAERFTSEVINRLSTIE